MSSEPEDHPNMQTEPVKQVGRCGITSEGITIAGYHLSWILIILIAIVVYLIFKPDTLSGLFGDKKTTTVVPAPVGVTATVNPNGTSIFRTTTSGPAGPAGEVGRMFGHSTW